MDSINYVQGSPEWKLMRRTHVMASDAPIIMGVSPWRSIHDLYLDKTEGKEQPRNSYMERGVNLEEEARRQFELVTGHFVTPKVLFHPEFPWLGASLDGTNGSGIIVEIKCPGNEDHEKAIRGEVPVKYYPQLQQQMLVAGAESVHYFSYRPEHGHTWTMITVPRDQAFIDAMFPKLYSFYLCIINKTPPPKTMTEHLRGAIKGMQRVAKEDELFLMKEERLAYLITELAEMEDEAKFLREDLITRCGDTPTVGDLLTFTPIIVKGSVDYSAIPELRLIDKEKYRREAKIVWRVALKGEKL